MKIPTWNFLRCMFTHGIRDEEADRDEAFVKALCQNLRLVIVPIIMM